MAFSSNFRFDMRLMESTVTHNLTVLTILLGSNYWSNIEWLSFRECHPPEELMKDIILNCDKFKCLPIVASFNKRLLIRKKILNTPLKHSHFLNLAEICEILIELVVKTKIPTAF